MLRCWCIQRIPLRLCRTVNLPVEAVGCKHGCCGYDDAGGGEEAWGEEEEGWEHDFWCLVLACVWEWSGVEDFSVRVYWW
jgi:hypothetical protein